MSANELMKMMIEGELAENFGGRTDIIDAVRKCIPHIKCLGCLDTRKVLFTSEAFFFGGTYEEFTCPACTGARTRLDSHHQISHARVNGRQVPYNGGDRNAGYSRVLQMHTIYKQDYEQGDLAEQNKPTWEFMDSKELAREMGSGDAKVDIKGLVGDITQLLMITGGNIAALPGFLGALDVSLKYYWSNETAINSSFHKAQDEKGEDVYIKFEYKKIAKESGGAFGFMRMNGSTKKEKLSVLYFIAKPLNDSAKKICSDLMNHTIQSMVNKLKK
jgi:hypothetical protein